MKKQKRLSIGRKITFVVLIAVFVSVISATGFILLRQTADALEARAKQLTAIANVFAASVSSSLANNNRTGARFALRAIRKMPDVPVAFVLDENGKVFASAGRAIVLQSGAKTPVGNPYDKNGKSDYHSVLSLFRSTSFPVKVDVVHNGEPIGSLLLVADVSGVKKSLLEGFLIAGVVIVLACMLGYIISTQLKRSITRPIKNLMKAMLNIQDTHDFSLKVERESNDETGQLVDSFNEMLSQISKRDEKLANHRALLEQTVADRTKELSIAKDAAEHANMAKSDFLATMSHEIRTPMNGVLVMAELLAGGNLMPRQQRYAEVIVRSGQSLLTIINDILDLSKIEAGKLELEQVPLSPAGIIDDVVSLFWQRAASKNVDIASFVGPDVPNKIYGDPVRLNQVLSNLVNNALKFTETGYVAIAVKAIHTNSANGPETALEFSVTDTGIGIAADKVSSVFQEFTQADQTTTRKFGGTGLGLSICKKLVSAMNGTIEVASVLHRGSRFFFKFPVKIIESAPVFNNAVASELKRAIVVLDGFATRQSIAGYLSGAQVGVDVVEPQNMHLVDYQNTDVIFVGSDMIAQLPARTGKSAKPYIVAVTQLGDRKGDRQIEEGRADDILVRPIGRSDMVAMVTRLMAGQPRGVDAILQPENEREKLPQFTSSKILIADDNAVNREVIIEVLHQLGVRAMVAEDGKQALEKWQAGDFDLVFMDCSMPVMDGYTATAEIRKHEQAGKLKHTPIIALTAHIAGDNSEKWRNAGMDDFITKPFTIKTIARRMANFLPINEMSHESVNLPQTPAEENLSPAIEKVPGPKLEAIKPVDHGYRETQASEQLSMPVEQTTNLEQGDVDLPKDLPVLNQTVLADMKASGGGSSNLLGRVLKLFEEHAPPSFDEINSVAKGDDLTALADAAHGLKSMCANIGAARAAEACNVLELAARTQTPIDIGKSVAEISSALNEALAEVKKVQAG